MTVLSVVSLSPGVTSTLPLGSNPDQVAAIRIANESPYALTVTTPDNAVYYLPAWMEDLIRVRSGSTLIIVPNQLPGTPPVGQQSTAALVTLYNKGDIIPTGDWPIALARQVNIGNSLQYTGQAQLFTACSAASAGGSIGVGLVPDPNQNTYITGFSFTALLGTAKTYQMTISGIATALIANPTYNFQTTTSLGLYIVERFPYAMPGVIGQNVIVNFNTTAGTTASLIVYGYFL